MAELLDIFRAMADPTRMRIMHLLGAMELSVGELAQAVGQSQPRVSRHVKILAEADLIDRRKEGNWVFLRLAPSPSCRQLMEMFADIPAEASEGLWLKADLARLAAIRADRMRAADDYFAAHAEQWDALGSLYVPEAEVEQAIVRALGAEPFSHLLDLGTGTGRMIALLGERARHVDAIDRSPDMLRLARAKLPQEGADKYNLLLGDFCALPFGDAAADLVTAHQILHYSATPQRAIAEAARVLKDNGRLLIVDFEAHDREELRTRDQHERLGFSDDQIADWFAEAGIALERTDTLPGGELTVKLWLGRRKSANVTPIRERQIS
ncbi:metalloregulator ArsR/SmtB family transcription factor [Sphingobium sp. DEHP117]|uniref:ArsR/SmtB family transcription factor n=1 Tax=Sphingobium sp. DEHP117 TaxID=2993436 RepID=UPI0027D735E3|nr:metalloregulator ArsR/SmtB family transcription factor [Sphingobium sp. DEHP117]MDQ4421211.1 metalloregulator ArsR/SmtB family transcription factor [Sphingobium sp. DEHP117]